MRSAVESALRRVWGARWNGVARAEFRRSFGLGSVAGVWLLTLPFYAASVWALAAAPDFSTASAIVRGLLGVNWLVCVWLAGVPVQRMLVLDNRLGVTDAWLMTSEPRGAILLSRLAGRSATVPIYLLLLLPLYVVGAAGMSGAEYPLFVTGHVGRFIAVTPPEAPLRAAGWTAAGPIAVMAVFCDLSAALLSGSTVLGRALRRVGRKRFWRDPARTFIEGLQLGMSSFWISVVSIAAEVFVAGGALAWCIAAWEWPEPRRALVGAGLAVPACVILAALRLLLVRPSANAAGASYDAVMLEDGQ